VIRDLGAGLRLVRKQPGFAAVIVLSLALSTGATTARAPSQECAAGDHPRDDDHNPDRACARRHFDLV
jgi:hypothetical protein